MQCRTSSATSGRSASVSSITQETRMRLAIRSTTRRPIGKDGLELSLEVRFSAANRADALSRSTPAAFTGVLSLTPLSIPFPARMSLSIDLELQRAVSEILKAGIQLLQCRPSGHRGRRSITTRSKKSQARVRSWRLIPAPASSSPWSVSRTTTISSSSTVSHNGNTRNTPVMKPTSHC